MGTIFSQTLHYYAIAHLSDKTIAEKIRERFKADGEPLFLIHNLQTGLSEGDFIRFKDKVVMIDGQVWQTLRTEKALSNLKSTGVTTVKGLSSSSDWSSKANAVSNKNRKKAYKLGEEIIKIFETQFTSPPQKDEITVVFSGNRATLVVPDKLLNSLALGRVTKTKLTGKMSWAKTPVNDEFFQGEELSQQIWAVDQREPSSSIKYRMSGDLPGGVIWNKKTHSIEGTPADTGKFPIKLTAISTQNRSISFVCTLSIVENQPPIWANYLDTIRVGKKVTNFPIFLSDMDHPAKDLTFELDILPVGFKYNKKLEAIIWQFNDSIDYDTASIKATVTDPLGQSSSYDIAVSIVPDGADEGYTFATLSPPWDTLSQGTIYNWDISTELLHWKKNHLKVRIGTESDSSTVLKNEIVTIDVKDDSLHTIIFEYEDRVKNVHSYEINIPVIPNRAPYFTSSPDKFQVNQREEFIYAPETIDPEGEEVTYSIENSDSLSPAFEWRNDSLIFYAEMAGTYNAVIKATDSFGNSSTQRVALYANKIRDKWVGASIEFYGVPGYNEWGNITPLKINFQTRSVRFGIFTPDDGNLFGGRDVETPIYEEIIDTTFHGGFSYTIDTNLVPTGDTIFETKNYKIPFIYVGTQLIPANSVAKGKSLYADLGFSYNIISQKIHSFGLYFSLDFEAKLKAIFNSHFEASFDFWGRHLLQKIPIIYTHDDDTTGAKPDYELLKSVELLESFTEPSNLNLVVGATQWYHLGYGFFAGPSFQYRMAPFAMKIKRVVRENENGEEELTAYLDPDDNIYIYMIGGGVKYKLIHRRFGLESDIKVGYAGEKSGMKIFWNTKIAFGRWKR